LVGPIHPLGQALGHYAEHTDPISTSGYTDLDDMTQNMSFRVETPELKIGAPDTWNSDLEI
jgi:hypothetical protein